MEHTRFDGAVEIASTQRFCISARLFVDATMSTLQTSSVLPDVWLHVHVPKAGGSTLRQLMNRNFGKGFYNSNSLLEVKQYTRQDVSEIIRCHPWLRCFCDHKLSLDLPFEVDFAMVRALVYVRDPLERFISRYFFHRNFEEVNCIAQRMSFREFATAELIEKNCHPQTNSQIYFLNGGRSFTDMQIIDQAIATGQAYLFPIERFDESCICLEHLFPTIFADLSYVPANVSMKDTVIESADREFAAALLQQDQPVFELAQRFLNDLLATTFGSDQATDLALEEFRDRCSRRFHNFFPPVARGEVVPPIGTVPPPTKRQEERQPAIPEPPSPVSPVDPRFQHLAVPTLETKSTVETKPTLPTIPTLPE
jgi:hypothetical protein